jgi:hypothetical protein
MLSLNTVAKSAAPMASSIAHAIMTSHGRWAHFRASLSKKLPFLDCM